MLGKYDLSLYTEILLIFMYSIFLPVIQHFDQVPYLSLQFKAAKQYKRTHCWRKDRGKDRSDGKTKKET